MPPPMVTLSGLKSCALAGIEASTIAPNSIAVREYIRHVSCCCRKKRGSLTLPDFRLRRRVTLALIHHQAVGDVILVDVADVGDRFAADTLRRDALDVAEPHV